MPQFEYNKLVRDVVFENMAEAGQLVEYRTLDDYEILDGLKEKGLEEISELDPHADIEHLLEELGDLQGVIEAIAAERGISMRAVLEASDKKARKAGMFVGRHWVGVVEVPEDSPWYEYVTAHTDQYPQAVDPTR